MNGEHDDQSGGRDGTADGGHGGGGGGAGERRQAPRRNLGAPGQPVDPVTGLHAPGALQRLIESGRLRHDRRRPLSLLVIAIDDLHAVQMVHGPARREQALRSVADELRAVCGPSDVPFRGGPDRFVVLRSGGETGQAWVWAEGLRERVRDTYVGHHGSEVAVTVSIGLHTLEPASFTCDTLDLAETAACVARERGGDRVCTWESVVIDRACDHAATAAGGSTAAARAALVQRLEPRLGPWRRALGVWHGELTARLAVDTARRLGAPGAHLERISEIAALQALGSLAIPETLLGKPESLTHGERAVVNSRGETAGRIAQRLGADEATAECVRLCHARFDDPSDDGVELDGPQPRDAQIVAAAATAAALIEARPQRAAMPASEAVRELMRQAGGRLAPDAARAASAAVAERGEGRGVRAA